MLQQIGAKIGQARSAQNRGDTTTAHQAASEAMAMLEKIEVNFDNLDWRQIAEGDAQLLLGAPDKAERAYRQAITAAPDMEGGYQRLADIFIEQNRMSDLEAHVRKSMQRFSDNPYWNRLLGLTLLRQEKITDAIPVLAGALQQNPDDVEVVSALGIALHRHGMHDEAIMYLNIALRNNPTNTEYASNLAIAMDHAGHNEAADELYSEVLRINPFNINVIVNLALLRQRNKQLDNAENMYKTAFANHLRDYRLHANYAHLLREMGRIDDAIVQYKQALAINPNDAISQFMISSLSGETPNNPPDSYVSGLFDFFSSNFESSLVDTLQYRIPGVIKNYIDSSTSLGDKNKIMLDLGCGTGLVGLMMHDTVKIMHGVDLSPKMLAQAAKKEIYGELFQISINDFMAQCPANAYNVVTAADVLIYIGDVAQTFKAVAEKMARPGLFVFSIELMDESEKGDFVLRDTARYAQKESYIKRLATENQFTIEKSGLETIRKNAGQDVAGMVFMLRKD